MKKLIICLVAFMSQVAAAETHIIPLPDYLKDATITIVLKNGEKHSYKSKDFAVVPREQQRDSYPPTVVYVSGRKYVKPRPNSVKLYGGVGSHGLEATNDGAGLTVKQSYGFNFGLGYGRKLTEEFSLDGILLMNPDGAQGGLLGAGYHW